MSENVYKQLCEDIDDIKDDQLKYGDYMRGDTKKTCLMDHSDLWHLDAEQPITEPKDTPTRSAGSYYRCNIQWRAPTTGRDKSQAKNGDPSTRGKKSQVVNMKKSKFGETVAQVLVHSSHSAKPPPAAMMKALLKASGKNANLNKANRKGVVQFIIIRKDMTWINETTKVVGTPETAMQLTFEAGNEETLAEELAEKAAEKKAAEKEKNQPKGKGKGRK